MQIAEWADKQANNAETGGSIRMDFTKWLMWRTVSLRINNTRNEQWSNTKGEHHVKNESEI